MNDHTPPEVPADEAVRVHEPAEGGAVIEVTVAAPVATVWRHLREPDLIARWHGWDMEGPDGADALAAEIEFIYREHAREGAAAYTLETKGGPAPGNFAQGDRFDLTATEGDGTLVRITRSPKGSGGEWDEMYDDITQGWTSFMAQLRFAIEQQAGATRRTVFLAAGPGPSVRRLLGADELSASEPFAAPAGAGIELAGRGWFRSAAQTGLAVDGYGPGLVVLADMPTADPGATSDTVGSSMAIVSTFGLDDEEFGRVEEAWQSWWATHRET